MATVILIKLKQSGLMKQGSYGISWTYLIFGWFVPIFRSELGVAALHFLFSVVTLGLWQLVFSFLYNKQYMNRVLTNGWELAGTEEQNLQARAALGMIAK